MDEFDEINSVGHKKRMYTYRPGRTQSLPPVKSSKLKNRAIDRKGKHPKHPSHPRREEDEGEDEEQHKKREYDTPEPLLLFHIK